VTVASIVEATARKPETSTATHKPYVPVSSLVGGTGNEPKTAGSMFQILHQGKPASLEAPGVPSVDERDRVE
jgi:hypothetical protein